MTGKFYEGDKYSKMAYGNFFIKGYRQIPKSL